MYRDTERRDRSNIAETQRPRESQKERDTQQPVPAKIVGSPEMQLLPGTQATYYHALEAWKNFPSVACLAVGG